MTGLIDKVRAEFAATSRVHEAANRWQELSDTYDQHPCHSPERRAVGEQIAGCLAVIADGIEESKLASLVGFSGSADELRRDMAGWRNGDDPGESAGCDHEKYWR